MEDAMFKGIFNSLPSAPKQSSLIQSHPTLNNIQHMQAYDPSSGWIQAQMMPYQNQMTGPMIAEPAQVMVMVPGTRTAQAESRLATLRSYIFSFILVAVGLLVFGLCYYFIKKRNYEGRELPGAIKGLYAKPLKQKISNSNDSRLPTALANNNHVQALKKPEETKEEVELNALPPLTSSLVQEDIVQVYGILPIWTNSDIVSEVVETKVSENNNHINNLIKSREDLTKHFEALTKLK